MTQRNNSDNSEKSIKGKGDDLLPRKDQLEHAEDVKHARTASKEEHQQALDKNKNKHSGSAGGHGKTLEVVVHDAHGKEKVAASRHVGGSEKDVAHLESRAKSITREELHKAALSGDITAGKLVERMNHAKNKDDLLSVQREADKLYGRGEFARSGDDRKHNIKEKPNKPDAEKKDDAKAKKKSVDTGLLEAIKNDGSISKEKRHLAEQIQEMRSATKKIGGSTGTLDSFAEQQLGKEIAEKQVSHKSPDLKDQIWRGIVRMGVEDLKVGVGVAHGGVNFVVNTLAGVGNAVRIAGAAAYQGTPIGALCPDLYPDKEGSEMLHKAVETTAVTGRVLVQLQTTFNPTSPLYGVEYDPHGAAMTRAIAKAIPKKIGDELNRLAHADTQEKAAVATEAVLNIATLVETGGLGAAAKVGELKGLTTVAKIAEDATAVSEISNIAKVARTAGSVEHLNPAATVVKGIAKNLETQSKNIAMIAEKRPSLDPLAKKFDDCVGQLKVAEKQEIRLRAHDEHVPTERPKPPDGMTAGGKKDKVGPPEKTPQEGTPAEKTPAEGTPPEGTPAEEASGEKMRSKQDHVARSAEETERLRREAGTKRYPEVASEATTKRPVEDGLTTELIAERKAESVLSVSEHVRLRRRDMGEIRDPYNWRAENERFSNDVVRQKDKDSCVSAVGEMLSNGTRSESFFEKVVPKAGNYHLLAEALGDGWSARWLDSLSQHPGRGPWMAELLENAWTEMGKSLHAVAVDGFSHADDVVYIRDPWEGTKYEFTVKEFERIWTGNCVLRARE